MKKDDVKVCVGENVKQYAFSGSVIYREDFWTFQPSSILQEQHKMDVAWCVLQKVLMVGRSVPKRFGRKVDPRDGLE